MKSVLAFALMLMTSTCVWAQRYWIATTSSNWNNPSNWSLTSGGAGGASVPGPADAVIFNGAGGRNGTCVMDIAASVAGITVNGYSGTINLSGFDLTTTGANTFTTGTLSDSGTGGELILNTTQNTTFNGTVFNVPVSGSTGRVFFSSSVFNSTVDITKTTSTTDIGPGGCRFNNALTLTNASTSPLYLGVTNADQFHGVSTFNINSTGSIEPARGASNTLFNNNIIVNYNSTGLFAIGNNNGSATLNAGFTITVNTPGTNGSGNLTLARFTQLGSTAQTISLSGNQTAVLTLGPSSAWNGAMTSSAPVVVLNSSTFHSATAITQFGDDINGNSRGGNVFHNNLILTNSGDADMILGSTSVDAGDIFHGTSEFHATGGGRLRLAQSTVGNIWNGTATFYSSGTDNLANRIQITRLAGSSATFNAAANFINEGNNSDIHMSYDAGSTTTFNGPVSFSNLVAGSTAEFFVGYDGVVIFNNSVTINCTSPSGMSLAGNNGSVTMTNGTTLLQGANGITDGIIRLRNFTHQGGANINLTLTGTSQIYLGPSSNFSASLTISAPRVFLEGAIFNGTTSITKTGDLNDNGSGGNTFNGATTVNNVSAGYLLTGSVSPDIFNGPLTVNNTGTNFVYLADNVAGNQINHTLTLNNSGLGIRFANGTNGAVTMASGAQIVLGSFDTGELGLRRFTHNGGVALSLAPTGTSSVVLGPSSTFAGNFSLTSPRVFLNGATFHGITTIEKTGPFEDISRGGNIFNSQVTITNSSSEYLMLGNGGADQFNGPAIFNNTGSYRFAIAYSHAGQTTSFASDVTLNANKSGGVDPFAFLLGDIGATNITIGGALTINCNGTLQSNIRWGAGAGSNMTINGAVNVNVSNTNSATQISLGTNGTTTFNSNVNVSNSGGVATISFGEIAGTATLNGNLSTGTFNGGVLNLFRLSQTTNTAQTISLTGTALLRIGPGTQFQGTSNFSAPRLLLNGVTFGAAATLTKTGAGDDFGAGGNIFQGSTILNNSGSGFLLSGATNADAFNNNLTINNSGSNYILLAHNTAGNTLSGNLTLSNTGSALGIRFAQGSATANFTMRANSQISTGAFSTGELGLRRFIHEGGSPLSLTTTGNSLVVLGPSSSFGSTTEITAPRVQLNGTSFAQDMRITKTGPQDDIGLGGNTVNGAAFISHSGSGYLMTGSAAPDMFNGTVTVNNTSEGIIYLAHNSAGNIFKGDVILNSSGSSLGVYISTGATGGVVMEAGAVLRTGASGFSAGELRLSNFVQNGNATWPSLTFTNNSGLRIGTGAVLNANFSASASRLYLDGGTFNGNTTLEKTGAFVDESVGGNTFNGPATLRNSGTGTFSLCHSNTDTFNAPVTYAQTAGVIRPAFGATTQIRSDLILNTTSPVTFGSGGGEVVFSGTTDQSITLSGSLLTPTFERLTMNKLSGNLIVANEILVSNRLNFISGKIANAVRAPVTFGVNATATGASHASFVLGEVRKTGNSAFTFPVGAGNFYRPLAISAPSLVSDQFSVSCNENFDADGTNPPFVRLSLCHFWIVSQAAGNSNVRISLGWDAEACANNTVNNPEDLRVALYDGAAYVDLGNGDASPSAVTGFVTSAASTSTFGTFVLASASPTNFHPVVVQNFTCQQDGEDVLLSWVTTAEEAHRYFRLERKNRDGVFRALAQFDRNPASTLPRTYEFVDQNAPTGTSTYRLVQVDDAFTEFFFPACVTNIASEIPVELITNPAGASGIVDADVSVDAMQAVDLLGRPVPLPFTRIESFHHFETDKLANGFYLLRVFSGNDVYTIRMVVAR